MRRWLAALALLLLGHGGAQAEAFVWTVSRGDGPVHHLIGSVHMLPPSAYPLAGAYEHAYANSSGLIFETDMAQMQDPAFQGQMMQLAGAPDGLSAELDSRLNGELKTVLRAQNLPEHFCEPFRAWFCAVTLQMVGLLREGMRPDLGVDLHYHQRAQADGKTIAWLETPEQQMALLTGQGSAEHSRVMLTETLRSIDEPGQRPADAIAYWLGGNRTAMEAAVTLSSTAGPELYETLLAQRNRAWISPLDKHFADRDTRWLLVAGAAHMVGPDSVPQLLRQRGYTVTATGAE